MIEKRGDNAQLLGDIAEKTFDSIITSYASDLTSSDLTTKLVIPTKDILKIDRIVEFPGFAPVGSTTLFLETYWQIKSTSQGNRKNCELYIKPKDLRKLYERYNSSERKYGFYFAKGFANYDIMSIDMERALDRFSWYFLDIFIFIDSKHKLILQKIKSKKGITVRFGENDALNLHTITIMWAFLWVKKNSATLTSKMSDYSDMSTEIILPSDHLYSEEGFSRIQSFTNAIESADVLTESDMKILSMANQLYDINLKIQKAGEIDHIRNYCPESLSGELNMWICSRLFRAFMHVSRPLRKGNIREKYLPIRKDIQLPLYRYGLCLVKKIYESLGVEIMFIESDGIPDSTSDRGFYHKLGVFHWLSRDEEGNYLRDEGAAGQDSEIQDFLASLPDYNMTDSTIEFADLVAELGIPAELVPKDIPVNSVPNYVVMRDKMVCAPFDRIEIATTTNS